MERPVSHEALISQVAEMGWIEGKSMFPHITFDCPSLCRVGSLFRGGCSPDLKEFGQLVAARFAAGKVTIQDMVQLAFDFLEPKYVSDLPPEVLQAVPPEVFKMALALQVLEEAWHASIFDWYNVALDETTASAI